MKTTWMTGMMVLGLGLAACEKSAEPAPALAPAPVVEAPKAPVEAAPVEVKQVLPPVHLDEAGKLTIDWERVPAFDMAKFKDTKNQVTLEEYVAVIKSVVDSCTYDTGNALYFKGKCDEGANYNGVRFNHLPKEVREHERTIGAYLLNRPEVPARILGAQLSRGPLKADQLSTLEAFMAFVSKESDPSVLGTMLTTLGTTTQLTPEVLALLVKSFQHEHAYVRIEALSALKQLDSATHSLSAEVLSQVETLAKQDANTDVRGKACAVLGQSAQENAHEVFKGILDGRVGSAEEAGECLAGLVSLWLQPAYSALTPNPEAFELTLKYLPEIGKNTHRHASEGVRAFTFQQKVFERYQSDYAWFDHKALSTTLKNLAAEPTHNRSVRNYAVSGLASLARKDLLEALAKDAESDKHFQTAIENAIKSIK